MNVTVKSIGDNPTKVVGPNYRNELVKGRERRRKRRKGGIDPQKF